MKGPRKLATLFTMKYRVQLSSLGLFQQYMCASFVAFYLLSLPVCFQAQVQGPPAITQGPQGPPPGHPTPSAPPAAAAAASPYPGLYPNLEDEYMGLNLVQYRSVSLTVHYSSNGAPLIMTMIIRTLSAPCMQRVYIKEIVHVHLCPAPPLIMCMW